MNIQEQRDQDRSRQAYKELYGNPANWFLTHYRTRQRDSGTLAVARQLRKQGVPLEVALAILAPPN